MLYSAKHNVLLYETDAPLPLLAATEGGRRINGAMVAIPATLGNLQALAARSLPVMPIMEKDGYDWPIRKPWTPLAHQKITANFLVLHKRCFCLNDMGTMKTLSALWAADYLMEMERRNGRVFRAIISAPLSILRSVWADALFGNFMARRSFLVLHGSATRRERLLKEPADFYIINHDGLGVGVPSDRRSPFEGLARELDQRPDIRLAIVDEASVYRDATTKRHRVARRLIGTKEYLWLMTGTPTPNGPLDAYGLARLVNNAGGESFIAYKNRIMMPAGPYKWLPRVGSAAAANKLLQPAVRYAIEDCVDLPPCTVQKRDAEMSEWQAKEYKALKRDAVILMKSGKLVHAVNQAALRIKLIQIACIAHGTVVLTDAGWKEIQDVRWFDLLWDGEEFVRHSGLVFKGSAATVQVDGVRMTPEHEVLTISGWWSAKEIIDGEPRKEFARPKVWLPDCDRTRGVDNWFGKLRNLAVSMRLRAGGPSQESISADEVPYNGTQLWVPPRQRNAQDDRDTTLQNMDAYAAALRFAQVQGLEELRRARRQSVRTMEQLVRGFLGGYGEGLRAASNIGQDQEQRGVQQSELPVGDVEAAGEQQATPKRMVYDIANCGKRHRFVVRGEQGQLLIVHNCGAVYDGDHESHELDAEPRISVLEEVIEQCTEKVIVFAPLTNVLNMLYKHLSREVGIELKHPKFDCAIVNGAVSQDERTKTFRGFQSGASPRVILADPATMAHGLTLTAASCIVWFAPTDKTELYIQANKRIDRPGQTKNTTIVQIAATAVEREIYLRLENNQSMQGVILKLAEER